MSSGLSSGCPCLRDRTLRAYLESHGIDPDAFADLPDDMQSEFLQSLPDSFGSTSEASGDDEAGASADEGSPSLRVQLQGDVQGSEPGSAQVSRGSGGDADLSQHESAGCGSDNSADLQSYQGWMQPQQSTRGFEPRPTHHGQAHPEPHFRPLPLNPELRELLECHGIDVDAFADMPDDIQSEILRTIPDLQDSASPASAGSVADSSADESENETAPHLQQQASPMLALGAAASSLQTHTQRPAPSLRPSPAAAPPPTDSRVIFSMGFDPALVARALRCKIPFPVTLSRSFYLVDTSRLLHSQRLSTR
jgi:hypothetical protein